MFIYIYIYIYIYILVWTRTFHVRSMLGRRTITGHQIGRMMMILIPTKTISTNLLFGAVKSWIGAVWDRFISKCFKNTENRIFWIFFLSFYIDPGGQISHPGAPGSDSGGEKHQKIDIFWKIDFLVQGPWKTMKKIPKNSPEGPKPGNRVGAQYAFLDIYIYIYIYIYRYIYIYILRCILYGFLKLALPGVMNLS